MQFPERYSHQTSVFKPRLFALSYSIAIMYAKFFTIAALVSAVVAVPSVLGQSGQCTSGSVQCCQRIGSPSDTISHLQTMPDTEGLVGDIVKNGVLNGVKGLVGLQCTPVTGQGASGVSWLVLFIDQ